MPEIIVPEKSLSFEPGFNLLRITQRKVRAVLFVLTIVFLILFGLYGLFILFSAEATKVFYLSFLTDMFLLYLWQERKQVRQKIRLPGKDEILEVSRFLDRDTRRMLSRSWSLALRSGSRSLRPIHFFIAFGREKDFKKIIKRLDSSPDEVSQKAKRIIGDSSLTKEVPAFENGAAGLKIASDFKKVFYQAYLFCLESGKEQIEPLDVLWAISRQENLVGMLFDEFGISPEEIEKVIEWRRLEKEIKAAQKKFFYKRLFKPKGKLNRVMTATLTPLLDKVSQDLTYSARRGDFEFVIGREKELFQIFNFFSAGKIGVVLVGENEVGKKAILKKLAQLMVEEEVPNFLRDKRLIELDLGALVSLGGGQKSEEYLRKAIYEVNRAGNIVLVIEDIDNLAGLRSQESGLDLAEILFSALENQALFLISTSLPEAYAAKIEGKILGRVLDKIEVGLPSRDFLYRVLITKIYLMEKKLDIFFSADALDQAIDLADRYIYGRVLPVKVIDLLTEAAYLVSAKKGDGIVRGEDIVLLVSRKTEIPLGEVEQSEKEKLLKLEELIHQRVINQEEAVKAVGLAMRRSRLETKKRKRPIVNLLFIGPTGVGKTELAKTLARVYFGDEKKMIRLDMSEYQEKRGLRRLIGLRTEQGVNKGYLTESVKRQSYSLILLDEIEKAHPDILNLFLQVMDDGRLTDASGETVNFSNVILIATSNAGTQFIQQKISQKAKYEEIYRELKERVLLEYFRPEFLNRFDKIVLFEPLSMDNIREIARLFIGEVNEKLKEKGVEIEAEREALDELASLGYDPLYGARPLRRVIAEKVEDPLARFFLEDKIKRRDKLILKKGLTFGIRRAPKI